MSEFREDYLEDGGGVVTGDSRNDEVLESAGVSDVQDGKILGGGGSDGDLGFKPLDLSRLDALLGGLPSVVEEKFKIEGQWPEYKIDGCQRLGEPGARLKLAMEIVGGEGIDGVWLGLRPSDPEFGRGSGHKLFEAHGFKVVRGRLVAASDERVGYQLFLEVDDEFKREGFEVIQIDMRSGDKRSSAEEVFLPAGKWEEVVQRINAREVQAYKQKIDWLKRQGKMDAEGAMENGEGIDTTGIGDKVWELYQLNSLSYRRWGAVQGPDEFLVEFHAGDDFKFYGILRDGLNLRVNKKDDVENLVDNLAKYLSGKFRDKRGRYDSAFITVYRVGKSTVLDIKFSS